MAKINWFASKVKVALKEPERKLLLAYAFQVEAQAKVNITDNEQVDTGFMLNSVYISGGGESSYGRTDPGGTYTSQKTGDTVKREIAPEERPSGDSIYVVVGAEYAIFQEARRSFLYTALEQVVGTSPNASIIRSEA